MIALRESGAPSIVLGTMNFGKRTNAADATAIIRHALDRGITAFDTANIYCEGESERILGRALTGDRNAITIATKVGAWKREGLGRERVKASIRESLERLGTSYVDLYYLHVPDHATPLRETLLGMKDVIASGAARAWGVSNYASWQIADMGAIADEIGLARPVIAQQIYNLVHRELEIEHFAWKRAHPIHLTVYNALAAAVSSPIATLRVRPTKGSRLDTNPLYRRRYVSDVMFARAADIRDIAAKFGVSIVELARMPSSARARRSIRSSSAPRRSPSTSTQPWPASRVRSPTRPHALSTRFIRHGWERTRTTSAERGRRRARDRVVSRTWLCAPRPGRPARRHARARGTHRCDHAR